MAVRDRGGRPGTPNARGTPRAFSGPWRRGRVGHRTLFESPAPPAGIPPPAERRPLPLAACVARGRGPLVGGCGEQALDRVRLANLAPARGARDERADLIGASRNPARHRHRETALAGERLGRGETLGEPPAQQPLAEPALDFKLV